MRNSLDTLMTKAALRAAGITMATKTTKTP